MASEMDQQNTDKTQTDSAKYLGVNYGNSISTNEYMRNACQQYHNAQDGYNAEQYTDKKLICEPEGFSDDRQNSTSSNTGNLLYNLTQRINSGGNSLSCDDYSNLNSNDWGTSSSDTTAKDSTVSSEVLSDKQSLPESNVSPISTSSSPSSAIQTSSGPASEVSSNSTQHNSLQDVIPMCIYILSRVAVYLEIENTANSTVAEMMSSVLNADEFGLNKSLTESMFTLWMCSPFLELQLKPTHRPVQIRRNWKYLLGQYSQCTQSQQNRDEPRLILKRNTFCSQPYEERIKDPKILELLFVEAKYNILEGRYPCEIHHCITLGGIQARIELGPYNPQIHSINFFREQQWKFLPAHIRKSSNWTWLPISSKNSAEVRLLEQFKRIPQSATNKKLIRKYLEFCWSLPFYGSAYFQGQIEQPVRGLTSLMIHQDIPILIAINPDGIYVIDNVEGILLLGLRYEEFSWEYARPSREDNPDCLPCLFLQFMVVENGAQVSKVLQIFSRQTQMMDRLISMYVDRYKKKIAAQHCNELNRSVNTLNSEVGVLQHNAGITIHNAGRRDAQQPCLSNKLNRLVLCTFDEEGRCVGKMGSWSFSY